MCFQKMPQSLRLLMLWQSMVELFEMKQKLPAPSDGVHLASARLHAAAQRDLIEVCGQRFTFCVTVKYITRTRFFTDACLVTDCLN
jgi:hypothetical protein